MSLLESFLTTPMAAALGWSLLHSLWEGAIIAAALAAVLVASRSPRLRYASACAAMLTMIAAFVVTIVRTTPDSLRLAQPLRPLAPSVWNVETLVSTTNTWNPSLDALARWLAAFWVAGVVLFYLRHVAGLVTVRRLRQRGVCCAPESWQNQLLRLRARMRISRPVLLLESCLADTPMVIGHLRPVILMPVGLMAGLPAAQIEAILMHELAHIRRYDYLINLLQQLVEGFLFYHPAVWWISRVVRSERESCCDDAVVSINGDAHEYAVALAALEQNRFAGPQAAVAATGGSLVTRIRRLLYPKRSNAAWTPYSPP
jgi:beta-lactamase regulating signal transducer with metallopeptidase domain